MKAHNARRLAKMKGKQISMLTNPSESDTISDSIDEFSKNKTFEEAYRLL